MIIFTDYLYPTNHIKSALKEAYGSRQGLLEMPRALSFGTRVGIPVAAVRGPSLYLLTSYNGTDARKDELGGYAYRLSLPADADIYPESHIIESHDGPEQPQVWEV